MISNEEIEQDDRKLRDCIIRTLKGKISSEVQKYYQRGSNIWSFCENPKPNLTFETTYKNVSYNVRLSLAAKTSLIDIIDKEELNLQFRQVLNIIIKSYLKELKFIEIGKNAKFFKIDEYDKNPVQNSDLKVWIGFTTSVHVFQRQPYLLIDYSTRVLREETALERMSGFKNNGDLLEYMKEQSVMASYGNHKIYRVHDIDFKRTPLSTFELKDKKITFKEYFKQKYNLTITNSNQPILIHINKQGEEICLIPELMRMTGLKDEERADGKLMRDLSVYTKKEPSDRMERIWSLFNDLSPKFLKENMQLEKNNPFGATLLRAPDLIMKKKISASKGFFVLKDPIFNPIKLDNWVMIYMGRDKRDDEDADYFVSEMIRASEAFGIKVHQPSFIVMNGFKIQDWEKEISLDIKKNGAPQIILSWIPENQKSKFYKPLKELFYSKLGVNHQNVLSNKFLKSKNKMSVASKILLQINAKLGKPIWQVQSVTGLPQKVMLVGVDVYHKTIKKKQSCAGFVASLDDNFTTYYSTTVIQGVGEELMKGIAIQMQYALKTYLEKNKYLPELIIFYRDGVGESQMMSVVQIEIEAIKRVFTNLNANYQPGFIEILVNKRISHRMFAPTGKQNSQKFNIENPQSGTLLTEKIVNDYFDFYLVPQYVTQGTATPTHYSVIQNNTKLTQDILCQLTYFQCFNYANWTGAVRVPAVVQYAHKLAYLVGDTFQSQCNQALTQTLCYL